MAIVYICVEFNFQMGIFPASFVRVIVDLPIAMHPSEFPKSHESAIGFVLLYL